MLPSARFSLVQGQGHRLLTSRLRNRTVWRATAALGDSHSVYKRNGAISHGILGLDVGENGLGFGDWEFGFLAADSETIWMCSLLS